MRDLILTKKQKEAFDILNDNTTNELLFGGGAGGGKSRLGCLWIILKCMEYAGIRCLIGRNKFSTLKQTTMITLFDVLKAMGLMAERDFSYNAQSGTLKFLNGSIILFKDLYFYPSDPEFDNLGSLELTYFFIDECNQVVFKCYDVLKSRLRYKHRELGIMPKCLLTCNPSKNWVYKEFYKPSKEGTLDKHKKFLQSLAGDNPFLPETYIEALKKIQIKSIRERLYKGNWEYDDDPTTLFDYDSINNCFNRDITDNSISERYLIGDIARKGNDRMVLGVWYGLQLKKIIDLPYEIKEDISKSTKYIVDLARAENINTNHIILDEDGVGCLTKGTEILTLQGWKKAEDIRMGDKVYSKDKNNNLVVETIIDNKTKQPTDIIELDNGYAFSYCHFLPYKTRNEYDFKLRTWDGITKKDRIIFDTGFNWVGENKDIELIKFRRKHIINIDKMDLFLGWFVSEGSCDNRYVIISQNNTSRHIEDIKEAIDKTGFKYYIKESKSGELFFIICNKSLMKWLENNCYTCDRYKSYNKKIPDIIKQADKQVIENFLSAFNKGDGYIHKGVKEYSTSSEVLSDDLLELIYKTGKLAGKMIKHKKDSIGNIGGREIKRTHNNWCIYEMRTNSMGIRPKIKRIYKDNVYYITITGETRLFLTRFKDYKAFFTHNGGVVDNIKGCIGFSNNASAIQTREYDLEPDKVLKQFKKEDYQNLKAQCYFKLSELIKKSEIGITEENPDVKDLISEELMAVKQRDIDKDTSLRINSKDNMKEILGRSPDFADMMMMRMLGLLKKDRQYRIISL